MTILMQLLASIIPMWDTSVCESLYYMSMEI